MYVWTDVFGAPSVQEMNYVFGLQSDCQNVLVDASYNGTNDLVPTGGPLSGFQFSKGWFVVVLP